MFEKLTKLLKGNKESPEQCYLREHKIELDLEQGYLIDGLVLNSLSERLSYFSNRKLHNFDDLNALYLRSMLINEKIDLEIAHQNFVQRLGNTEANLLQLKQIIATLNQYYRTFLRDKA